MSGGGDPGTGDGPSGALLAEALRHAASWRGRTVVVKVGGGLLDGGLPGTVAEDLVLLHGAGVRVVAVHGGGAAVSRLTRRLGREPSFVDGLRVTDDATMELVEMALGGQVNLALTGRLRAAGAPAVGVTGLDGGLLRASPHPAAERLGRVGRVDGVDPALLRSHLRDGFLPVVSPVAGDGRGRSLNVNADEAAGAVAGALEAEKLVILTDVDGVYRDVEGLDDGPPGVSEDLPARPPISRLSPTGARKLLAGGGASRGMVPKLEACLSALGSGVASAHVVGGGRPHAALLELFTDGGVGTMIRDDEGDAGPGPGDRPAADGRAAPAGPAATSPAPSRHCRRPGERAVSGPPLREVARLTQRHLMGTYRRLPVAFARGEGVRLWDLEGREYLDFLGGIAVSSLGHADPELMEALRDQVGRLLHVSNLYHVPEQAEAARLLTELSGLDRAFFCNSGAEAVEAALKLARKWGRTTKGPDAWEIVVAEGAFHGRTLGALAATADPAYREPFGPLPEGFRRVPFDDPAAAREAVGARTCAVLVEPVQGERGVVPADPEVLAGLQAAAREHGALFVLDEVQTGVGRTGAPFAFQRYELEPDAVTLAKGLGGGVPVGALLARGEAAGTLVPGDHASTFGGNPLASRAACTVLDALRQRELCENAGTVGRHLRGRLEALGRDGLPVERVRGMGLLLGIDVPGIAVRVADACLEDGLLVNAIGDATLRLAPPLVVTREDADRAVDILRAALARASSPPAATSTTRA